MTDDLYERRVVLEKVELAVRRALEHSKSPEMQHTLQALADELTKMTKEISNGR